MDFDDLLLDIEFDLKEELERLFLDVPLTDSNCEQLQKIAAEVLERYRSDLQNSQLEIMISPTLDVHVMTVEEFQSFYDLV